MVEKVHVPTVDMNSELSNAKMQQMSNQVLYLQQRLLQEQNYAQQLTAAFSGASDQIHQQQYMRARFDSSTSSNERDSSSRHSSIESSWPEAYNVQLYSAISKAFSQPGTQPNSSMNRSHSEVALEENLMNGQCMVDDLVSK